MDVEETVSVGDSIMTTEYEELPTVSGGDAGTDTLSGDILAELQLQSAYLENMEEMLESGSLSIWEKPIEDYTPTEGILLILLFILLFVLVYELVGGIIICKK